MEIADASCKGLTFRITSGGAKTWSYRYRGRNGGRVQRVTIGGYPSITLGAARQSADAMRATVAGGGNPVEDKRRARVDIPSRSFEHLAARYLKEHAERHKRSHAKDRANLNKHVLPKWKKRDYRTIRRADVIELVEGLITAGKPVAANRVQSLISGVFTFALDSDLVEANPCHRLRKRGVENVGNRVLSDCEIRLFWRGVIEPERARRCGLGLRLALLTGARVGEIAGINRAELESIDKPESAGWLIPGARTKNKRDHFLPLPTLARETVLELLALIEPAEQFLFPTRSRKRNGPIRGNTLTQAQDFFGKRLKKAEAATWRADPPTPHDLRRTVETRLAGLGVAKEHRDRVLNHIGGSVGEKHYNRYDYANEKRAALSRWDRTLTGLLHGGSGAVLTFRPSKKGKAR